MTEDEQKPTVAQEARSFRGSWSARRLVFLALKLLIIVVVLWFIRRTLIEAWAELQRRPLHIAFAPLLLSGGLYLGGTFFCGLFWQRVLHSLGQKVSLWQALGAYYVGHLGKYVPGKAMVVVLRAGMISSAGGDAALTVAAVFFETFTMIASGAFLAAVIIAAAFPFRWSLVFTALSVMIITLLPTVPPVFRWLVRRLALGRLSPETADNLAGLSFSLTGLGWLLNLAGWAMLGLSYTAVLWAIGAGAFAHVHLHVAAVCLATVVGFVSFLPAGAVVREAILAEMMASRLGGATALTAALLLRLVWLTAELAVAGGIFFGSIIGRIIRR